MTTTRAEKLRARRTTLERVARGLTGGVLSLGLLAMMACGPQEEGEGLPEDTIQVEQGQEPASEQGSAAEQGRIGNPPGEASGPGTATGESVASASAEAAIQVSLTEFEIGMPERLSAGETVFHVTNEGTVEHNFEVEGQGIERELQEDLRPGESDTLRVELEPGTYRIYCPVNDHEDRGMSMEVRVTRDEA